MMRKTQMSKSFDFVAIGDLHLDGKLKKFIPNLNEVILNEVRVALNYARRNGIQVAVYLGDVCDVPKMSPDAHLRIMDVLSDYPDIKHIMITGNHDTEDESTHSLQILKRMSELGGINNLKVIDKPTNLYSKAGTPVRFLPWPHFSVGKNFLNVMHIETNGSQWDHGKSVESERDTNYTCLSGHLHTKQIVGRKKNIHFVGTLYQTNFGERLDKYFGHCSWDGTEFSIDYIPNKPAYSLHNLIITEKTDLEKIIVDPFNLYKCFVKSGVDLSVSDLEKYSNVVKINSFKSRQELEALLSDELLMQDVDAEVSSMSVLDALQKWMLRSKVDEGLAEKTLNLFNKLSQNKVN